MDKSDAENAEQGLMLVLRAAEAAARWHGDSMHKDGAPFINHLIEVAGLVTAATEGRDPSLTAAALLHDAIEKAGIPAADISEAFGKAVCTLVMEVTDTPGMSKQERRRQIASTSDKSVRAKLIKLADKTSNLRALARAHKGAKSEDSSDYADWAEQVARGLRGSNAELEAQFDAALAALRRQG
jgi:(p)ppGpp synthase/HD superfamily hydrolase